MGICHVSYRVNNLLGLARVGAITTLSRTRVLPLQPGSDYATPIRRTMKITTLAFTETALTLRCSITITPRVLSIGGNDFQIKYIDLTITNDNLMEFNEDLYITLYRTHSELQRPLKHHGFDRHGRTKQS
jgi:hypothetical protein